MSEYKDLKDKSDEELLEFITSNPTHYMADRRDLAKAILDVRSAKIMQRHNKIMIWLTGIIALLTLVITALTALLVYREFWQRG